LQTFPLVFCEMRGRLPFDYGCCNLQVAVRAGRNVVPLGNPAWTSGAIADTFRAERDNSGAETR